MAMKMPKSRRVVKDVCHRLGSSGAEKKLAAQNLPREKLFKRELGSHRGIRPQILQSLKKCDIYEKIISEQEEKESLEYQ